MQDHYDKREDLGNCFETAQEEDPENLHNRAVVTKGRLPKKKHLFFYKFYK